MPLVQRAAHPAGLAADCRLARLAVGIQVLVAAVAGMCRILAMTVENQSLAVAVGVVGVELRTAATAAVQSTAAVVEAVEQQHPAEVLGAHRNAVEMAGQEAQEQQRQQPDRMGQMVMAAVVAAVQRTEHPAQAGREV